MYELELLELEDDSDDFEEFWAWRVAGTGGQHEGKKANPSTQVDVRKLLDWPPGIG